ncbi:hypothetical protein GYMLUDRAFT_839581 [Collybiopsis luxurians FD-317 M1]|uniref:BHLH domain-containing protein n=1 Tax=Collybiopsis luxurians FD-317 M1 TaxID=944289 RepID=A0A0D0CKI0_9AGAR|nr:hypothetical protein GYMLUDRAFT_839581 [Collybiopsis luxurians FD-317 M1]
MSVNKAHPISATVYNSSVNPSRRVKTTGMPERPLLPRQNTNTVNDTAGVAPASISESAPTAPAPKRGRKPSSAVSGLSRSARETQRKLNHSIIEKARRTKINDALAELARLSDDIGLMNAQDHALPTKDVTAEKRNQDSDDEEADEDFEEADDDDKDGDYGSSSRIRNGSKSTSKSAKDSKSKGKGKFKLDILVKTVDNMRFLLERVRILESELQEARERSMPDREVECRRCIERELADQARVEELESGAFAAANSNKRKRYNATEESSSTADESESLAERFDGTNDHVEPRDPRRRKVYHGLERGFDNERDTSKGTANRPSLPSISSWLPDSIRSAHSPPSLTLSNPSPNLNGHGSLPMISTATAPSPLFMPYLPSPPSSAPFPASVSPAGVPMLELGPSSVPVSSLTSSSASSSPSSLTIRPHLSTTKVSASLSRQRSDSITVRTPEEESAATLLLHMSTSPPVFTTERATRERKDLRVAKPDPLPPSISMSKSQISRTRSVEGVVAVETSPLETQSAVIAQTPSSILGLGTRS